MLPVLACFLAAQVPVLQPPRLRTVLPNGIVVLVERRPGAKTLVLDLFAANRGTDESPATHGRRHLLEHLVALGTKGDLDQRLETAGGFLVAKTLRDSIVFELSLPPNGLKSGLSAVKEVVTTSSFTPEAISREAGIMEEEGALRENSTIASSAAWEAGFGPRGLDPFGNLDTIRATKPEDLDKLRKQTFAASNLVVVLSGDVDLDEGTKAVKDALGFLPIVKAPKEVPPAEFKAATVTANIGGEYRAVQVPGYRAPSTAATLAAALALANSLEHAEVIYTPSVRSGLILLGVSQGNMGEVLDKARAEDLFKVGRLLASRWVRARLEEPSQSAAFRGMLMAQAIDVKPETMLENLNALPFADFERAVNAFKTEAVVVEGRK